MADTLLTKAQAAERLGVSTKTIERRLAKGLLTRALVHGPHGPEVRVVFPAPPDVVEATFTVAPETAGEDATPDSRALVQGVAVETTGLDIRDRVPDTLVLQALAEAHQESAAWARRYGQLEAERDALRAAVEALRRPWWRRGWDRVRRRDRV